MADAPLLYRLMLERRFAEALERFTEFPEEALWTGETTGKNGILIIFLWLPTDELLDPVTIRFFEAVLTTYPSLLDTNISIFVARFTHLLNRDRQDVLGPVILRLIRANPAAVSLPDFLGLTPFHDACLRNNDITILRAMLEVDPSLAFTFVVRPSGRENMVVVKSPLELLPEEATMGTRALVLLTSYYGRVPDSLTSRYLLHAASSCKCPRNYVLELIQRDLTLIMQRDNQGDNPLHCAARSGNKTANLISMPSGGRRLHFSIMYLGERDQGQAYFLARTLSRLERQAHPYFLVEEFLESNTLAATVKNNDGDLPLHVALAGSKWSYFMAAAIEKIIDAYPDAAKQRNNKGQLPLHIVLSGNWSKRKARIIRKLVKAYPESLKARDVQDRLPPVLQSALRANESANRLSTTYELMRKTPDVCTSFLPK